MLQKRILCVRCATSFEAAPVDSEALAFLPSSNGHSWAGAVIDRNSGASLIETEPRWDEPLELPDPVLMEEHLMQPEDVLEALLAKSPFRQCLSLNEADCASAQAETAEEEQAASLEELASEPEETAWSLVEAAEAATAWPHEEDKALASEEAVAPSEVSSSTLVPSSSFVSSPTLVTSSSFEAEVLHASEPEADQHDSPPELSCEPESLVVMDEQPVGFVHTAKDVLPYPDKYSLGVRLMRVSPVWLLGSGLLFISLIYVFNWATKPNAQANNLALNHSLAHNAVNQTIHQTASQAPAQMADKTEGAAERSPAMDVRVASSVNDASLTNDVPLANDAPSRNPAQVLNSEPAANPAAIVNPDTELSQPQADHQGSGNFTVQVGSYSDSAQAEERAASLRAAGLDARVVEVELPRRGNWYRVQTGRFLTREEATRYGLRLRTQKIAAETIIAEIQNQ
jgi:cell division protein FtsN